MSGNLSSLKEELNKLINEGKSIDEIQNKLKELNKKNKKLTKEDVARILKLADEGYTITEITEKETFSRNTIYKIINHYRTENISKKRFIRETDVEVIKNLVERNMKVDEIAEITGISANYLYKVFKEKNINYSKQPYHSLTEEDKEKINEMIEQGYSTLYIANHIKVARSTIARYLKRLRERRK